MRHGRPFVTWKFAATLDGRQRGGRRHQPLDHRAAGAGRRPRPARPVRRRPGRHRHRCWPTTRSSPSGGPTGRCATAAAARRRGRPRDLPTGAAGARRGRADAAAAHPRPARGAGDLHAPGRPARPPRGRSARWRRAFLAAGLVDEVIAYVAPMLLGAGPAAVGDLGIGTIADASAAASRVRRRPGVGADVRLTARPPHALARGDRLMFTGIVEELGARALAPRAEAPDAARLTVRGPLVTGDAAPRRLDRRQRRVPHGHRPRADAVHRRRHARDAARSPASARSRPATG